MLRHFAGMALAMMAGMVASAAIFLGATGATVDEALREHPVLFVVVQALGMTTAMVAWMRLSGHAWRGCAEMAGAMVAPAVALICLRLLGAIGGPICGTYCALTIAAMVLVMVYRRSEYGAVPAAAYGRATRGT